MFSDLLSTGGLSLDRLRNFCLVAEASGVTKAAKGDPARQSLFSRQIKELEEYFGIELVLRKGRGITLTTAGEQLHILAREQLLGLSDFRKSCAGRPVEFTIGSGDSLIQWLLLPRIAQLRRRLPRASFRFLNLPTVEVLKRLREGTIDLGIVRDAGINKPLKTAPLGQMTFSLFVPSARLPKSKISYNRASLLSSLPLAALEGTGQYRQELDRIAEHNDVRLNIQLELSSFPLIARALRFGSLAAVLPTMASTELCKDGLAELKPDYLRSMNRKIVLAWNPRTALIRVVIEKALLPFRELCDLE